jgi:competence protein ComEC
VRAGVRLSIYEKLEDRAIASSGDRAIEGQAPLAINGPMTRSPDHPILTYGTRLRILAKLHPARNYRNPGAFDYEGYLRDNGISVLGSAEASDIERLPGFSGSRIELWRTRVHASIIRKIHQLWPASEASLMDAMVLGEESFLRNATRTEYQRSGTYHVLVVSGMNLSILAFAIFWVLRQFRVDPAAAAIATVVVVRLRVCGGSGASGVARRVDARDLFGARLLYRERNMMNAIGAAALGVLDCRSARIVWGQFSADVSRRLYYCGHWGRRFWSGQLCPTRGLRLLRSASYDLHVSPQWRNFGSMCG